MADPSEETRINAPYRANEKSILIVEDDDFQRQVLKTQLNASDVEVLEARNGIEALEHVDRYSHCISLILCDLDMPVMDGMEFVRNLGEREFFPNLALLSSTDASMLSSVDTMCRAYGVKTLGTFEKPLSRDDISRLLENLDPPFPHQHKSDSGPKRNFSEREIITAIESGEIQPHFQAKLDLATNALVGAETLARWYHPQLGIQAPFSFIPILEQSDSIDALTFSLLRQTLAQKKRWQDLGYRMTTAINLSPASFRDSTFADQLIEVVSSAEVAPESIVFELTETAAMQDLAPALENLARLRLRGFGLSIDDFGTGFASMEQLGRIAFTELKIDRSFVSNMLDRRESRAIVEFSINMAQKLGMRSVAEGVERAEELALLREMGCDQVQGYFIGMPVNADSFTQLLLEDERCTAV